MTRKFWKRLKISYEILSSLNNKEAARWNLLVLKNHWIVRNKMQEIALSFSFSAKRQHQLQETLKETLESQEEMGRWAVLWGLCETRWGADALRTLKISFDVILKALEVHDNIQDSKARGFIQTMLKFEFIMALIACEWLLRFIVPLTNYLQRVDLNLPHAHTQAKVVIQLLRSEPNNEFWNKLYQWQYLLWQSMMS